MSSPTATAPLQEADEAPISTPDDNETTRNTAAMDTPVMPPQARPPPEIDYGGLALVFLAPALGGFLYGYDIGATSFVLSMMRADRDYDHWWHNFSKVQQGLFVSCLAFGALIGSHIVLTFLATSIGRRKEIRIAATLFIVGAMLNVMSGTILATTGVFQWPPRWYTHNGDGSDEYYSYEYTSIGFGWGLLSLLMGRILYGAGVGFIMHGAPTYMAEMSPSHVRGAVVSAKETVIVFGIVVGMLMGDLQSDYPANWTDLYGYSILFAVPMLLLTFRIPRSKRWLLMKGYKEEARQSMQFVYKGNVEDEFERMAENLNTLCCNHGRNETPDIGMSVSMAESVNTKKEEPEDDESNSQPDSIWASKFRNIMGIGMGLLLAQQFSGQPCVLAYSRVLFEAAGWSGNTSVITVTIMGVVSSFTVTQVDRLGRKKLLMAGSSVMLFAVTFLAIGFWGWDENSSGKLGHFKKNLVLWSMFLFISGYQIGFGPISWTVLSEIYPTEIRGSAMALSVEVNFFAKFLTQFLFPVIQDMLGWGTTFVVFFFTILSGLVFVYYKVPETKGMTLEEIQAKLKNGELEPIQSKPTQEFQYANMESMDRTTNPSTSDHNRLAPIV
mmetsp:Transcript_22118/g.54728  ORF Transcript_22118/g.54728 Transcript_22118/m.54728 type:complete len:611 (+) Transcript_22118:296-2128(+)